MRQLIIPSKIIGIYFTFITKIPGDTLRTKMPAELPSTEQIFAETNCLVPLERDVVPTKWPILSRYLLEVIIKDRQNSIINRNKTFLMQFA